MLIVLDELCSYYLTERLFICYTGRAQKVNPRKNSISMELWQTYSPNLQSLQTRIQSTYPANYIKITCVVH